MDYGSSLARTLMPGESFIDQVTVTRFYDLSQSGKYTIGVALQIPPRQDLGKGVIKSNSIVVTVTK